MLMTARGGRVEKKHEDLAKSVKLQRVLVNEYSNSTRLITMPGHRLSGEA